MILDEEAQKLQRLARRDSGDRCLAQRHRRGARGPLYANSKCSAACRSRSFCAISGRTATAGAINEHLRSRVQFEEFNLLSDYGELGRFDVIFCRNVLIYFDVPTKQSVLEKMARVLAPDGYLFMGAAETVVGLTDAFVPHEEHRSINVPRGASTPRARPCGSSRADLSKLSEVSPAARR